jgi:putative hydrolase
VLPDPEVAHVSAAPDASRVPDEVEPRDPVADLREIAYLLERAAEPSYRVKAFRGAATLLAGLEPAEVRARAQAGTLRELAGVGEVTARCITESLAGEPPVYLRRVRATESLELPAEAGALLERLQGDCHTHTDASDGGSPAREMAAAAIGLGHAWMVISDHSPHLRVARGLSAERLESQLDELDRLNADLAPFRLLSGIEVDIMPDGTLDQRPDLLDRLDVVVGSVHSELRMPSGPMTERLVRALASGRVDVLGHCTGRKVTGKGRPESEFEVDVVFEACRQFDVAVEVNSRPERLDPPKRLLRRAIEAGCYLAIDTDAHAPGQLEWQGTGCERVVRCGLSADEAATRTLTAWSADEVTAWTRARRRKGR